MMNSYDNSWNKFQAEDEVFFKYMDEMEKMNFPVREVLFNFPVFVGQVNIARMLFFYELYKKVIDLSGDIIEIGTYKGASFMLWAKLVKLFENNNMTKVWGCDWFQGMNPGKNDNANTEGLYKEASYDTLNSLVKLQNLDNLAIVLKMDATKELEPFLNERPYLRFKIVFVDCAMEEVLETSLRLLWPRLVTGGILIVDHFGISASPMESEILQKYIEGTRVYQMPFNRHSSGYVIKGE